MPVPLTLWNVLLAVLPLVVTVITILWLRWPVLRASLVGFAGALFIALLPTAFHLAVPDVGLGLLPGALGALHVVYVLLAGAVLYQMMNAAGAITQVVTPLTRLARSDVERALLITGALGPFFESATGFGVGVLMAAPLYRALGFDAERTVWLCLLTQSAVPWGAMAAGTTVNSQLSGVLIDDLGRHSALLSIPVLLLYTLLTARIAGGRGAIRRYLGWVLLTWMILSASLYLGNLVLPTSIVGVVGGLVTAGVLLVVMRLRAGRGLEGAAPDDGRSHPADLGLRTREATTATHGAAGAWRAWIPYGVLLLWAIVTDVVPRVHRALAGVAWHVPSAHFALLWLTEPGFALVLAALSCVVIYRLAPPRAGQLVVRGLRQMVPAAGSTILLMAMATLMERAGMTDTLGHLAALAPAWLYIALVPLLGGIGGYLSGSNSAGNAMFVPLHVAAAQRLHLPVAHVAALQNVAASNLTMDGPARLAMATAAAGDAGRESRYAGRAAALGAAVIGIVAVEGWMGT
ncbi:MAG: L-lactate permease [Thermoflavifilum sp.]|nr:L-lactate permease [Thermoflavifilum sp.]MCL6515274.1 L-lactate permease [Alicyclobacillus sp.]